MTVGVAVVGAGFWGKNHLRVLREVKGARVLGVCETDEKTAREVEAKYQVPVYNKLEPILSMDDVEAITVCTPTTTHYTIARKALEAGKHVLVEKPMTSTLQEAWEIIKLSEKTGAHLSVGFIERFNPAVRALKNLIKEGVLGRIILVMARRVTRWPERVGDVGVTKDSAIHDIDVMRYLMESEVEEVYAKAGSLQHRFEDYMEIMIRFENGVIGFIDANWLTPRKTRHLIATGSEATGTLDYITQEVTIEDSEKSVKPKVEWSEPLKLELQHFISSLEAGEKPCPNGVDGLKALEVCEAALKSSRENRVVKISELKP